MYRHCVPYVFRVDLYIRLSIFPLPRAFLLIISHLDTITNTIYPLSDCQCRGTPKIGFVPCYANLLRKQCISA
jgi:hypothetical protein